MRYLKHKKTGRKFLYTDTLAKHPDLEEVGTTNSAPTPEPTPAGPETRQEEPTKIQTDEGLVNVADATKDALDAYVQRHFGTKLDKRKSLDVLADQVLELIREHGHPDFD